MLARLTRTQAFAVLALFAGLFSWCLMVGPTTAGKAISGDGHYSDMQLYRDIADAVREGQPYYGAATALQRAHGFPTAPFVTVRLPTLAWLEANLGWQGAHLLLEALLLATAMAWFAMVRQLSGPATALAAAVLVVAGGAMAASPGLVASHELWAGTLISLALALRVIRRTAWAFIAAALAVFIRELALPFVAIMAWLSWHSGQRREAAAWMALIAAFAVALVFHALAVTSLSRASDALSQGWGGLRGPVAIVQDIADVTLLHLIPAPFSYAAVLLCLAGFAGAPAPLARIALPWLLTVSLLLAVFARPVNFYWAILSVPVIIAGLAFLPRAARDLATALSRRPLP